MSNIKLGSHVGMAGKEMFLASAKASKDECEWDRFMNIEA